MMYKWSYALIVPKRGEYQWNLLLTELWFVV